MSRLRRSGELIVGMVALGLCGSASVWGQSYRMVDLGTGGPNASVPTEVGGHGLSGRDQAFISRSMLGDVVTNSSLGLRTSILSPNAPRVELGLVSAKPSGYGSTGAVAMNAAGHLTGTVELYKGATLSGYSAFTYDIGGGMRVLGTPNAEGQTLGRGGSRGTAINASGQVTGSFDYWSGGGPLGSRAFRYTTGSGFLVLPVLGSESNGYAYVAGNAINNKGEVTGSSGWLMNSSLGAYVGYRAFRYSDATGMRDLGSVPGFSCATPIYAGSLINDDGQVAGYFAGCGEVRAFVHRPETGMVDMGFIGPYLPGRGMTNNVRAMNAAGQIVGRSSVVDGNRITGENGYRYTPGVGMQGLGSPGGTRPATGRSSSTAADINFRGDIVGVGSYYAGSSSNARALVAFAGGVFEDLNPYVTNRGSVFLLDALKINDLGYILATAIVNGEGRYYLLVPAMEECLMNWAEKTYPDLFKPAGPRTVVAAPYKYRYYQQSRSYVGVSTADAHAYYMLADGVLRDAGSIADFAVRTGCSG